MYFRKTVHCWCVGSSWIDLPVPVFITCLFTLEMPQAILKFKKVSDIVIDIAGLEFVSVTQYSLHFGNLHSSGEGESLLFVLKQAQSMKARVYTAPAALVKTAQ